MQLAGKVVFVTGGSRGIGRAICQVLSRAGAAIALGYHRQQTAAEQVQRQLQAAGGRVEIFQLDVTCRDTVRAAICGAEEQFDGLDGLVNNAGINRPTDFDQISEADWDEILAVNLKGPMLCAQEALPAIRRRGGGAIVNIGSVSGQYGGPRTAHYAASKAGLISLGQVIARFAAPDNIRCNTLAVGLIASEMADAGLQAKAVQQAAQSILLKRLGTPEEVGDAVAYLLSDGSRYITGQTINLNGGLYF